MEKLFSEWYLNRRYAKDLAEGSARERKRWESWNRARMAAKKQGREFSEPAPPAVDDRQPEDLT